MFNLTPEELFQLFYDVCAGHKTAGYPSGKLAGQSSVTQAVWLAFHDQIQQRVNGNGKMPIPIAKSTDDFFVSVCEQLGEKGQKALYQYLYNLGHRINR